MSRVLTALAVVSLSTLAITQQWKAYARYTEASPYYTCMQPPISADGSNVFAAINKIDVGGVFCGIDIFVTRKPWRHRRIVTYSD